MNSIINRFINENICIHCNDILEIETFLELCESKDLRWLSCSKATYQMPTILEDAKDLYFFYEDYFETGKKFLTYSYEKDSHTETIEFSSLKE